jgi:hypothetical protein
MEKKSAKRKHIRRRLKRYAAAVAGAAIMAGVSLPGTPIVKAEAANKPWVPNPVKNEQALDKDAYNLRSQGWHEHKYDWPSPDENQGLYKDGKIYYRSDNSRYDRDDLGYVHYLNPVSAVRHVASFYGFDPDNDSFTLVSRSDNTATVQIIQNTTGKSFLVDLERTNDSHNAWQIVTIRG